MELTKTKNNNKILTLTLCGLFTALCAVGAFIKVPIPVVPFTLQYLFTMFAGLILGGKNGALSVGTYVFAGLIGLPIFAEGGGLGYFLKPSFGYLIGFILGAYITGKIAHASQKLTIKRLLVANFAGLFVVYAIGMIYYYFISNLYIGDSLGSEIGLKSLFLYCFVFAIPGDIILCIIGAVLGKRLIPITQKYR